MAQLPELLRGLLSLGNAASSVSSSSSADGGDGDEGSAALATLSAVCGWAYFVAWSLSFYPQVIDNFRRRSVVGLSFDFLLLNVSGFTLYSLFNCCMFWSSEIHREYFARHSSATSIPVKLNDVVFALHALALTLVSIVQCFFFERGGQRPSIPVMVGAAAGWTVAMVFVVLGGAGVVRWLDTIDVFSYLKLAVTLTKYVPQAVMNFRRKCTEGWSIGNIILDITGGILSFAQMVIDGINYDNWMDFWGNPVKWGLSIFSLVFDIFFLVQHYGLYRNHKEQKPSSSSPTLPSSPEPPSPPVVLDSVVTSV
eukprot:m51a1_g8123 putative cystinosin homolog isoform 1 (310) ;mRNA; f:183972-185143